MATVDDVRRVAREVVAARVAGKTSHRIGAVTFDLRDRGYCLRFVREVHEAALGLHEFDWPFAAQYAIQCDYRLRRAGAAVAERESPEIVCFNRGKPESATPGHIGIYLGQGLVAENTISASRGTPRAAGTKISTLGEVGSSRAMFFRTVPPAQAAMPDPTVLVKLINHATGDVLQTVRMVAGGDHVRDQRKLYVAGGP